MQYKKTEKNLIIVIGIFILLFFIFGNVFSVGSGNVIMPENGEQKTGLAFSIQDLFGSPGTSVCNSNTVEQTIGRGTRYFSSKICSSGLTYSVDESDISKIYFVESRKDGIYYECTPKEVGGTIVDVEARVLPFSVGDDRINDYYNWNGIIVGEEIPTSGFYVPKENQKEFTLMCWAEYKYDWYDNTQQEPADWHMISASALYWNIQQDYEVVECLDDSDCEGSCVNHVCEVSGEESEQEENKSNFFTNLSWYWYLIGIITLGIISFSVWLIYLRWFKK